MRPEGITPVAGLVTQVVICKWNKMIKILLIIFSASFVLFLTLFKFKLKIRLLWSVGFFVLCCTSFITLFYFSEDEATEGAITITQEMLEQEGKPSALSN